MAADLTPDGIRKMSFDAARRGYDRGQVDAFQSEVADRLAQVETQLSDLQAKLSQLGLDTVPNLAEELKVLGTDVTSVLEEARRAATDLRARAAADAAQWRTEVENDVAQVRSEAAADAEALRGHAWREASDMLELSKEQAQGLIADSRQDALFIRAEAERESSRMSADSRREAEELARSTKAEAERVLLQARGDSERILDTARKSAEAAQERARALEARRTELMGELEEARRSLSQLEDHAASPPMTAAGIPAMRVAHPSDETPSYPPDEAKDVTWQEDDGTVKIVPAGRAAPSGPIDADDMVAEVERLRAGIVEPPLVPEPPAIPEPDPGAPPEEDLVAEPAAVHEPESPAVQEPESPAVQDHEPVPEPEAGEVPDTPPSREVPPEPESLPALEAVPEPAPEPGAGPVLEAVPELPSAPEPAPALEVVPEPAVSEPEASAVPELESPVAPEPEAPPVPEPDAPAAPESEAAPRTGVIDDLFARLREPKESVAPKAETAAADSGEVAPTPEMSAPAADEARVDRVPVVSASAAFDVRDRLLLPIENRTLRGVKRDIVELQNRVLEELRVGEGIWIADGAMFASELSADIDTMLDDAYAAGHVAASELSGRDDSPTPTGGTWVDSSQVIDALVRGVQEGHDRAVSQDAGVRQTSAAVSRVFRGWRSDEAERRLRTAGQQAYHEGLIAGLVQLGVPQVTAVVEGRPCEECAVVSAAVWDPADGLPEGATLPPSRLDCVVTIIPV